MTPAVLAEYKQAEGAQKKKALSHIVEEEMGLVFLAMKKIYPRVRRFVSKDDLVQCGCLGLLKAVDRWDPEQGVWSSYAYRWISYAMQRHVREDERARVGAETEDKFYNMQSQTADIEQALDDLPERDSRIVLSVAVEGKTLREVAATENLTHSRVQQIEKKALAKLRKKLG